MTGTSDEMRSPTVGEAAATLGQAEHTGDWQSHEGLARIEACARLLMPPGDEVVSAAVREIRRLRAMVESITQGPTPRETWRPTLADAAIAQLKSKHSRPSPHAGRVLDLDAIAREAFELGRQAAGSPPSGATPEEHRQRHVMLHDMLDELLADFIIATGGRPSTTTVTQLLEWSWEQSQRPTGEHPRLLFSTADFSTAEGLQALKEHVEVLPRSMQDLLGRAIEEILRLRGQVEEARR